MRLALLAALCTFAACTDPGRIQPGVVPPDAGRIAIVSPASGDAVFGNVALRVEAREAVESVALFAGDEPIATGYEPAFDALWDSTDRPDGALLLRATARFADGTTEDATVAVRVDNRAPEVEILEPALGSMHHFEDAPFRFSVRATDASPISRLVLFAGAEVLLDVESPMHDETNVLVDPSALGDGPDATLVAEVTDATGASTKVDVGIHVRSRLAWQWDTLGRIETPALPLPDGGVAVGSFDGRLYVLAADGTERCRLDVGEEIVGAPALSVDGTTIYFGTTARLRAADAATCATRFTYATAGIWRAGPTVAPDGTIYAAEFTGTLHAISPAGAAIWTFPLGGEAVAAPTVTSDGLVLAGSFSGFLVAVGTDGAEKWRFETGAEIGAPALATDDAIYVGSYDFYVYALDHTGAPIWEYPFPTDGDVQCAPARLPHGDVAVCSRDGNVYAVRAADGTEKWRHETAGITYGGTTVGPDGTVYVGSADGALHALGPDGSARFTFETHEEVVARPTAGGGLVFVASADRRLYALFAD